MPLSNNQWLPDREWAVHLFYKIPVYGNYKTKRGWFLDSNYQNNNIDHPTPKPVYLIKQIIQNLSNSSDIIFDPFMGSGTTAVAAYQLGRRWFGCEISEEYCEIANKRIKEEMNNLFEVTK
jgi:DNA modification methylase